MRAYQSLPEGYKQILEINLQKDKKTALKVNAIALAVFFVFGVIGHLIVPIWSPLKAEPGVGDLIRLSILILGYLAYIVLHELTHAAAMKAVGGGRVRFGFTGMYAYAGSNGDFFDKASYRLIALAPLVVWGVIFTVLLLALPKEWFWVIWLLQIGNISGAAGDVYVTATLWKRPETILVKDTGIDMTVYDRA